VTRSSMLRVRNTAAKRFALLVFNSGARCQQHQPVAFLRLQWKKLVTSSGTRIKMLQT